MSRACSGCKECCTHIGVKELNKAPGTPCEHICGIGCGIYGSPARPPGCDEWSCLWLRGEWSFNDRPDKTGMVCWIARSDLAMNKGKKMWVIYASHRPGKPHKKTMRWLLANSYRYPIVLTPMVGNDPEKRTIYWKGKKIVDKGRVNENSNFSQWQHSK